MEELGTATSARRVDALLNLEAVALAGAAADVARAYDASLLRYHVRGGAVGCSWCSWGLCRARHHRLLPL